MSAGDSWGPIDCLLPAAFGLKKVSEFSKQKQAETVVNISSTESLIPLKKNHEYYSISKSALNMLTKSAAQEYGHLGIRINSISPGLLFRNNIQKDWPSGVKIGKTNHQWKN